MAGYLLPNRTIGRFTEQSRRRDAAAQRSPSWPEAHKVQVNSDGHRRRGELVDVSAAVRGGPSARASNLHRKTPGACTSVEREPPYFSASSWREQLARLEIPTRPAAAAAAEAGAENMLAIRDNLSWPLCEMGKFNPN